MLARLLLTRETGDLGAHDLARSITSDLIRSFAPAPHHRFVGEPSTVVAHANGIVSLALEKFDGRLLVSGGAEGSIRLWDLEQGAHPLRPHNFRPLSSMVRGVAGGHSHGITHLAFFPFDPDAFLSSSYDKSLRLWSTRQCALTASFHLNATVYSHASSPIANHLLVACATQHSNVRLIDLKSGSAVQALVAHGGPVLCVSWSPRKEYVLASGHVDGKIRLWDVRRAGGVIAQLDQDDTRGLDPTADRNHTPQFQASAQAHDEPVNGVQWTDDGRYIVSAGLDRRIRVWDAATGANTLASFGSLVQNQQAKTASFILTPSGLSAHQDLIFWPNDHEILVYDLHRGDLVTRLRSLGPSNPVVPRGGDASRKKITNIVWRGAGGGGRLVGPVMGGGNSVGAIYSAHQDGQVRAWMPPVPGPNDIDDGDDDLGEDDEVKSKKRKAVDDAYRSLMGQKVTFT
ncbi:hypothetical protein XA68_12867 [Ophiocordyceps unilateralis]|uniref:Uncharacterized protein n=1 Tax=Ophiocordyceps unilateralis TaxID=268505 RepID=A0A2A9PM90_OPHUN|nr:hypothetical protein XA68_12867 [Ophiocordyceps unilateralis]